jgi:hypothetical protein
MFGVMQILTGLAYRMPMPVLAVGLPYGYLIGSVVGTLLVWLGSRATLISIDQPSANKRD